ncbi:MAG: AAA family ATPase, partial [Hydrogenobacter sp.]
DTFSYLQTLEGFGYSVVRISPDGSIYTCAYQDDGEKRFYYLVKLYSNLADFYYTQDRKKQIIKNAENAYKNLQKKLSSLSNQDSIENIKEYKELLSFDAPIKEVREIINKAEEDIKRAKVNLFIKTLKEKLSKGELEEKDLKDTEEWIKNYEGEEKQKLEVLKQEILEHFNRTVKDHLKEVSSAIKDVEITDLTSAEGIPQVKRAREYFLRLPRDIQRQAQEELTKLLQESVLKSRLLRYRLRVEDQYVFFGSEKMEKFTGERRKLPWKIQVEEKYYSEGQAYVRIVFERSDGIVREPKRYSNIIRTEELKHPPKWVRSS